MLGTARGIAKSKIIKQVKRQERVRKCVRSGFFFQGLHKRKENGKKTRFF